MNEYRCAYHQMKFLCLLSLALGHSVSWVNQVQRIPLETLPGFVPLKIFSTFSLFFLVLAGVSFRLTLTPQIEGHRLTGQIPWSLNAYLVGLLILHALLDLAVYANIAAIFYWSFFKTLWIAFLIIALVGRVHFAWLAAISLIVNATFAPVEAFLRPLESRAPGQLLGYHLWLVVAIVGAAFFLRRWIGRALPPMPLRRILGWLLGAIAGTALLAIFLRDPTEHHRRLVTNWWIDAWVGNAEFPNFYILGVWLPTILNGFLLGHVLIAWRSTLEKRRGLVTALTCIAALGLYAIAYITVPFENANIISLWDFRSFQTPYWVTQALALVAGLAIFLTLTEANRRIPALGRKKFVEKWSTASFGVYLTVIIVARPLARAAADLPFLSAVAVVFVATCAVGGLAATAISFVARKKIRFRLVRANP